MLLLLVFLVTPARGEPTAAGRWLTDDGKGIVRIAPCGAQLCGWIAEVLDKDPDIPTTDVNNPDRRLRGRPLLGLQTLSGFTRSGSAWRGGRAYDPKSGRTYRASLELAPDGSLKLTGCVLFICETRRWTRTR
jgi:uncharacterized protein (DUF2147 family)